MQLAAKAKLQHQHLIRVYETSVNVQLVFLMYVHVCGLFKLIFSRLFFKENYCEVF